MLATVTVDGAMETPLWASAVERLIGNPEREFDPKAYMLLAVGEFTKGSSRLRLRPPYWAASGADTFSDAWFLISPRSAPLTSGDMDVKRIETSLPPPGSVPMIFP